MLSPRRSLAVRFALALLFCATVIAPSRLLRAAESSPRPPNIVFILADDLGYGDLSCYGQSQFSTPNIDRLAAEGVKFRYHYAGAPVCAPSRSALLTGQDTGHTYLRGNGANQFRPDPLDLTIATRLRAAGYRTGMIGKSCVSGNTQDATLPGKKGFDVFYGLTSHTDAHRQYPVRIYDQTKPVTLEGNDGFSGPHFANDLYAARAVGFIKDPDPRPFFLLLSLTMPHADLAVPEDSSEPFVGKFSDDIRYAGGGGRRPVEHVKATYAGMVTRIDRYVGDVLAALGEAGRDRDTLVIFTSDNGAHAEGGYKPPLFNSAGGLTGIKRDLTEGGIRVPFLARWPAAIAPGRVTDHVAAFWDFSATALELAGQPAIPADQTQGLSYAPTLTGRGEQRAHAQLYWEFHEGGGRRALRQGDWKLVQYDVGQAPDTGFRLYNLAADPLEKKDLAAAEPERAARMIAALKAARVASPVAAWNFKSGRSSGAGE